MGDYFFYSKDPYENNEICKRKISGSISIIMDNNGDDPTMYINMIHEWERKPWWHTFNRGGNE